MEPWHSDTECYLSACHPLYLDFSSVPLYDQLISGEEEGKSLQEVIDHGRHYCLAFHLLERGSLRVLYIMAFIGI